MASFRLSKKTEGCRNTMRTYFVIQKSGLKFEIQMLGLSLQIQNQIKWKYDIKLSAVFNWIPPG